MRRLGVGAFAPLQMCVVPVEVALGVHEVNRRWRASVRGTATSIAR
jgi:hypothetical protein